MTVFALIRHWIVYLLFVCGIGAFAVNYTAWFSAYLFRLVLFLPLFSLLLALPPLFSVTLDFDTPHNLHRGEDCALFLSPKRRHRIPCPYYLPIEVTISQVYLCDSIPMPRGYEKGEGKHRTFFFLPIYRFKKNEEYDIHWTIAPYPIYKKGSTALGGSFRIPLDTSHTTVIRTALLSAYMCDPLGLFRFSVPQSPHRKRGDKTPLATSDITVLPDTQKPAGRMRMWSTGAASLVPTQKPSEQYEIRDYRPGDALRSVHWKLSAKVDDLLVCESVEPAYRTLAITVDRPTDADVADCVYDALDWVLRFLAEKEHAGTVIVAWVNEAGRTCTETVRDTNATEALYCHMLSDRIPTEISPHAFASVFRMCDRGYHLDADVVLAKHDA